MPSGEATFHAPLARQHFMPLWRGNIPCPLGEATFHAPRARQDPVDFSLHACKICPKRTPHACVSLCMRMPIGAASVPRRQCTQHGAGYGAQSVHPHRGSGGAGAGHRLQHGARRIDTRPGPCVVWEIDTRPAPCVVWEIDTWPAPHARVCVYGRTAALKGYTRREGHASSLAHISP
eukprot:354316-Chlamydomonas_euryale.AAC.9